MKIFTFSFKSLLIAAGLMLGSANAWATPTSLYERGTTTAWSDADLSDWTASWCTPTISSGLNVSTKNGGWTCTKAISVTKNSIVTLTATLHTGGAPGRSGSYDYIKIGGVEVRFNEQDKVATIAIDGASSGLSLTYNRSTDYNIEIEIDQASRSVSYTVGSASGTSSSSTAITDVVFGHYKAGGEGYGINPILKKIEVSEEKQAVVTADYEINYKSGEDLIKTVSGTDVAVGTVIPIESSFFKDDVKYFKNGGEPSSLTVEAGGSTLDVAVSVAPTYSYTVNATDGTNVLKVLASGSTYAGEQVKVAYPQYFNVDGTLYYKNVTNSEYRQDVTISENEQVTNFVYTISAVSNVVYHSEGEEISGATATSAGNNMVTRSSNAQCGYAESDLTLINLPAGKYRISGVMYSNSSGGLTLHFQLGDEVYDPNVTGANNWFGFSQEFTLASAADVKWLISGDYKNGLDYVYIQKTAELATIGSTGWTTFASAYPLNLSSMTASSGTVTAYYASAIGDGNVTLTSTDKSDVAAGQGIMLKGTTGATITIPVVASGTSISGNKLVGCTTETPLSKNANYYVLVNNSGTADFQSLEDYGATIPAGKAYLDATAGGGAKILRVVIDGQASEVVAPEVAETEEEEILFNMAGIQVDKNFKGFVVNQKGVKRFNR